MKARVRVHNYDAKNNIAYLKDLANQTGGMTITNDAEAVVDYYRSIYGNRVRVVYEDTDQEWWELVWTIGRTHTYVAFKPWHGLVWDKLTKVES